MSNITAINPAVLNIPTYQRESDATKVEAMASSYSSEALGAITVSRRADGSLWVIDGAHRTAAAVRRGDTDIPAIIHEGLSLTEEANLFLKLNDTKQMKQVEKFLARVVAEQPAAVAMNTLAKSYGWKIASTKMDGVIVAVVALEYVYDGAREVSPDYGPVLLDKTVSVITDSWGMSADGVTAMVMRGVGRFIGRYGDQIDGTTLRRKLRKVTASSLIGQARGLSKLQGITAIEAFGKVLTSEYNKRLTTGTIPEWEVRK